MDVVPLLMVTSADVRVLEKLVFCRVWHVGHECILAAV